MRLHRTQQFLYCAACNAYGPLDHQHARSSNPTTTVTDEPQNMTKAVQADHLTALDRVALALL